MDYKKMDEAKCSFCGCGQNQITTQLIRGEYNQTSWICSDCVEVCDGICDYLDKEKQIEYKADIKKRIDLFIESYTDGKIVEESEGAWDDGEQLPNYPNDMVAEPTLDEAKQMIEEYFKPRAGIEGERPITKSDS